MAFSSTGLASLIHTCRILSVSNAAGFVACWFPETLLYNKVVLELGSGRVGWKGWPVAVRAMESWLAPQHRKPLTGDVMTGYRVQAKQHGTNETFHQGRIQDLWKGGGAQRRSRLKTLFGISKGGAQGACALFGPPWRPSLEFQKGGARPLRPPPESASVHGPHNVHNMAHTMIFPCTVSNKFPR